jgi:hypothetical protein
MNRRRKIAAGGVLPPYRRDYERIVVLAIGVAAVLVGALLVVGVEVTS